MNPAKCLPPHKCSMVQHAMPASLRDGGLKVVLTRNMPRNEFFALSKKDKSELYDICRTREEKHDSCGNGREALLSEIVANVEGVSAVSLFIAQGSSHLPRLFHSIGGPKFFPHTPACDTLNVIEGDSVFRSQPDGTMACSELNARAEKCMIGIPLVSAKQKLGMLVVEGKEGERFMLRGKTEIPFIVSYLSDIAVKCRDMMERWFDPVTGILNRIAYESEIVPTMKKWLGIGGMHAGHDFALLSLDLDRFKTINDTFGHGVGDLILRMSAETMVGNTRNICMRNGEIRPYTDWVVRAGGDEFLIVLQNVGINESLLVAERLRRAISKISYEGQHIKKLKTVSKKISASIGILTSDIIRKEMARDPNLDFEKLLDRICYFSKGPRNAVSYSESSALITARGDEIIGKMPYRNLRQFYLQP